MVLMTISNVFCEFSWCDGYMLHYYYYHAYIHGHGHVHVRVYAHDYKIDSWYQVRDSVWSSDRGLFLYFGLFFTTFGRFIAGFGLSLPSERTFISLFNLLLTKE